jgi:hypothetical protein
VTVTLILRPLPRWLYLRPCTARPVGREPCQSGLSALALGPARGLGLVLGLGLGLVPWLGPWPAPCPVEWVLQEAGACWVPLVWRSLVPVQTLRVQATRHQSTPGLSGPATRARWPRLCPSPRLCPPQVGPKHPCLTQHPWPALPRAQLLLHPWCCLHPWCPLCPVDGARGWGLGAPGALLQDPPRQLLPRLVPALSSPGRPPLLRLCPHPRLLVLGLRIGV